ncbi:hypothetical protein CWC22_021625 [Pseudoalteromonas rubra]|uniref:Uncharacterized protein n=1 Tax=Pseudoalteromonas rubra TaxID=43658 RepID=A0A5S3UT91_9GAMM|nr:hypothetical protein [Pseudoalteromonas rubra]QPB85612.1 hypothetical protein CWC22_021625 [Pseudoalteromonas rubra]
MTQYYTCDTETAVLGWLAIVFYNHAGIATIKVKGGVINLADNPSLRASILSILITFADQGLFDLLPENSCNELPG